MARSRSSKRQIRTLDTLQEKGITACAIGVGMLLIPFFAGGSPVLAAITSGLIPIGWMALVGGAALLGLHRFLKGKQDPSGVQLQPTARAPRSNELEVLRDVRNDVFAPPRETVQSASKVPMAATSWSPAVFAAIEWRRFEAVCEKLFTQAGFETKSQSHGADGGVDISKFCL